MAGVYIHIPFCKKACHYCDFHFTTNSKYHDRMVDAICTEISLKKDVLQSINPTTIYFGGGTPSILNKDQFNKIFNALDRCIDFDLIEECTIEANPDDIHLALLNDLKKTPITRFSLGIQSFHDDELQLMNRAHSSKEAINSIHMIKEAGFNSFTLDLIYGMPNSNDEKWLQNIRQAIQLEPDHLSAYCLTIEKNTVLDNWLQKGELDKIPDELGIRQFKLLIEELSDAGYEHYEISNFAKKGKRAIHNANYWQGKDYIGIGPSAHSYSHQSKGRSWNIAHNIKYMESIEDGRVPEEVESLSIIDQVNEYIMIRLRTKEGLIFDELNALFGAQHLQAIKSNINLIDKDLFVLTAQSFSLNVEGKLVSDQIIRDLFVEE